MNDKWKCACCDEFLKLEKGYMFCPDCMAVYSVDGHCGSVGCEDLYAEKEIKK